MGKQVPLVVYKAGTRTEVGKVSVQDDGSGTFQVSRERWVELKDLIKPGFEFSIGPAIAANRVTDET